MARLKLAIESAERRAQDAEMAIKRIVEELHEARLSLTFLQEFSRTIEEYGVTEPKTTWVSGGIKS